MNRFFRLFLLVIGISLVCSYQVDAFKLFGKNKKHHQSKSAVVQEEVEVEYQEEPTQVANPIEVLEKKAKEEREKREQAEKLFNEEKSRRERAERLLNEERNKKVGSSSCTQSCNDDIEIDEELMKIAKKRCQNESGFRVFAKTLTGKMLTLYAEENDRTEVLFYQILLQEGLPVGEQRLIHAGKELELGRTLADYHIQRESTVYLVLKLRGGKPVILLYPPTEIKAKVTLDLCDKWNLSEIHPAVKSSNTKVKWDVIAHPEKLVHQEKEYSYLFWEADTIAPLFTAEPQKAFCLKADPKGISDFLDKALSQRGLNVRERQDMITYWLPEMHKKPYVCIQFREEEYTQAAKLTITPTPDKLIRVFMTFWGAEAYVSNCLKEDHHPTVDRPRDQFIAVEWGGMNMDPKGSSSYN